MDYIPLFHPTIKDKLKKYPHLKNRFQNKVDYIIRSPLTIGEKLRGNYTGLRSIPLTGNFILIFLVCEECIQLGHNSTLNNCLQHSEIPQNTVIFLTFSPHDIAYRETYSLRLGLQSNTFSVFTAQ